MKKIIILFLACASAFASCDVQMDDAFDRNAAERINEMVAEAYDLLTAAPNGWVMEYYPEANQSYGGVNILMRFDADNGVEMISDKAELSDDGVVMDIEKSTYTIDRSSGAVLCFDTYNRYISCYADPGIDEGGGKRYGFMGDLNFAIKSMSATEIILQGTKTMNRIIMTAVPSDVTWEDYLGKILEVRSEVFGEFVTTFEATIGDRVQEMTIDPNYTLLSFGYRDENGISRSSVYSYMYTGTGIKFYKPIELFGEKMQNFDWNKEELSFICTDPGTTGRLKGNRTEYFRHYDWFIGTWKFYSYAASGSANTVMTLTITQKELYKSYEVKGIRFTNPNYDVTFDLPFQMDWDSRGRVSIISGQLLGVKDVTVSSVLHENAPVYLYSCSSGTLYRTSQGSGMISSTNLKENRVDFENNGVAINATGFAFYFYTDPTLVATPTSGGLRWLTTMYMEKQ